MPQISLKKLLLLLFIIILLSKLKLIIALFANIFTGFYDSFEPLRDSPPLGKYIAALLLLALLYITIFKLLLNRRK